jgi:hypothetical protein
VSVVLGKLSILALVPCSRYRPNGDLKRYISLYQGWSCDSRGHGSVLVVVIVESIVS